MGSSGPPRPFEPQDNLDHPDFLDLPRPPGPSGPQENLDDPDFRPPVPSGPPGFSR